MKWENNKDEITKMKWFTEKDIRLVLIIKLWETAEKYNIWISTFITIYLSKNFLLKVNMPQQVLIL